MHQKCKCQKSACLSLWCAGTDWAGLPGAAACCREHRQAIAAVAHAKSEVVFFTNDSPVRHSAQGCMQRGQRGPACTPERGGWPPWRGALQALGMAMVQRSSGAALCSPLRAATRPLVHYTPAAADPAVRAARAAPAARGCASLTRSSPTWCRGCRTRCSPSSTTRCTRTSRCPWVLIGWLGGWMGRWVRCGA